LNTIDLNEERVFVFNFSSSTSQFDVRVVLPIYRIVDRLKFYISELWIQCCWYKLYRQKYDASSVKLSYQGWKIYCILFLRVCVESPTFQTNWKFLVTVFICMHVNIILDDEFVIWHFCAAVRFRSYFKFPTKERFL
jgi:hypothetical protein